MSENVKYEYGCVMAMINDSASKKIIEVGKKLIPDNILYFEEDQEYGREVEPHVTIKFGLTENYSKNKIGKIFTKVKPFKITLVSIDIFTNQKFDVIKFNVESDILKKLNSLFSKLPNEDEYPTYNPHITLAYVKPGEGKYFKKQINPIQLSVNKIKYSNPIEKYYYDL
jgi:2'-5' RNA ligase